MAAYYDFSNPVKVDGLVLWASYPAANNNLAGRKDLEVISVYGTLDGSTSA